MTIKTLDLKKIGSAALFLPLLFMFSCIEKYSADTNAQYDKVLVVDGRITNEPGPYTITLSTTTSIEEPEFNPVSGATVKIADNEGNTEILSETKAGIYQTSENGFQGIIGRSYQLLIETTDGRFFESRFEELLAPVEIESVTFKEETHLSSEINTDYEDGYQFYVTTATSEKNKNFYCWELTETFEIHSAWLINYIYDGSMGVTVNSRFRRVIPSDTLSHCWKTITENFFTHSTEHFNTPKITNLPLHFIPFNEEMIRYKYSVLVNQLTISENTYNYLNALLDQDIGQEGLYTKQPYKIQGNVHNFQNSDEFILGYFIVAGVSNGKRQTVVKPSTVIIKRKTNCDLGNFDTPTNFSDIDKAYRESPNLWPIYVAEYDNEVGIFIQIVPPQECIDCTKKGGVPQKPDYWDQ